MLDYDLLLTSLHTIRPFLLAFLFFFFFNDTATTEIYTLSLHDALPISSRLIARCLRPCPISRCGTTCRNTARRSEEHTSELQSHSDLVCRLLLEKKKQNINNIVASIEIL